MLCYSWRIPNIVVVQPYSALYSDSSMAVASVFSLVEFLVLHWDSSYVLGAVSSALNDVVSQRL